MKMKTGLIRDVWFPDILHSNTNRNENTKHFMFCIKHVYSKRSLNYLKHRSKILKFNRKRTRISCKNVYSVFKKNVSDD